MIAAGADVSGPSPVLRPETGLPLVQLAAISFACGFALVASELQVSSLQIAATLVFLLGGLPHGAFDLHRAARKARMGGARLALFTGVYLALFALMMAGWYVAPAPTLTVFIVTAIIHFSEDWSTLGEPFLRLALGFAPLCAIGIGHQDQVETIFATMAGAQGAGLIVSGFVLLAPIVLLVAGTALFILGRENGWHYPAIFALMLASLFVLPPLIGFALFFCAFHTPRHLVAIRNDLTGWPFSRLVVTGGALTFLALLLGALFLPYALEGGMMSVAAGFQLLAALAMPHQCLGPIMRLDGGGGGN